MPPLSERCRSVLFDWYVRQYHDVLFDMHGPADPDLYKRVGSVLEQDPEEISEATYIALVEEIRGQRIEKHKWSAAKSPSDWRREWKEKYGVNMSESTLSRYADDGTIIVDKMKPKLWRIRMDSLNRLLGM